MKLTAIFPLPATTEAPTELTTLTETVPTVIPENEKLL